MKLSSLLIRVVLLSLAVAPLLAQTTPPREDNQFWNETQLIKSVSKNKDVILIGVLRVGRDFARPVDERVGLAFAWKASKYLTVAPTYIYVDQQPYAGRRIQEHRLVLNVTTKFKVGEFLLTDRNLIERRARQDSRDFTVYRNRLQIDHPARIGTFRFKPFIADEVWYSTQTGARGDLGWFRNRLSVGISKQFGERFTGDFFYLRQMDGVSRPGNVNVLGTLFRVQLP